MKQRHFHSRGLLSVAGGDSPRMCGRAVELLLRASPDATVLAVSLGSRDGDYPIVQRLASGGRRPAQAGVDRCGTGDPAVIVRQDLIHLSRSSGPGHVVLTLPREVDALPFLADLWRTPTGAEALTDHYRLAPVVAGISPESLLADLRSAHAVGPDPGALTVAEATARRVEGADVILLGRTEKSSAAGTGHRRAGVRALLTHLNPVAAIHYEESADEAALAALVRPDGRWSTASPDDRCDPLAPPRLRSGPDLAVSSVLWRSRRPLHPQRLMESLHTVMRGVARGRGHLWLAGSPEAIVTWRSVGGHLELRTAGRWLTDADEQAWREVTAQRRTLASWFWHPEYGERRNEITFVGTDLSPEPLRRVLDAALLTDKELALGAEGWAAIPDPLLGGG